MTVHAEWRNIERSLEVAVRQVEMAILDRNISPAEQRFNLQTVRAEPALLIARPEVEEPFADDEAIPIRLEVSVGLFGNQAAERKLLRALAHRLNELRGREWAPATPP